MEIGEIFKQRRIELGYSLDDAVNATKITKRVIVALENGIKEDLPAAVYVRGYIRSYCKFLKLDEKFILTEALKIFPLPEPSKSQPETSRSKNIVKSMTFTLSAMIVLLAFFIVKEFLPSFLVSFEKKNPPQIFAKKVEEGGQKENMPEFIPINETESKRGPLALKDAFANSEKKYKLEIKASELTWIRNKIDSDIIKEALLTKGETAVFEGNEKFELTIGNAGGISMILNGKVVENPGKSGEVKRITLP